MHVSGSKRLVNTYLGGDRPTGTLTSPVFTIERITSTFLIGGGGYSGKTCMNLLIDGQVACPLPAPTLSLAAVKFGARNWDVKKYKGKNAVLQIVDNALRR